MCIDTSHWTLLLKFLEDWYCYPFVLVKLWKIPWNKDISWKLASLHVEHFASRTTKSNFQICTSMSEVWFFKIPANYPMANLTFFFFFQHSIGSFCSVIFVCLFFKLMILLKRIRCQNVQIIDRAAQSRVSKCSLPIYS